MMQSNSYHNRPSHGPSDESYQEVFRVLDNLGMADLKWTFKEHCIQVFTKINNIITNNDCNLLERTQKKIQLHPNNYYFSSQLKLFQTSQ